MSRIFWDTMLLIYLVEGNPGFTRRAEELFARTKRRGDALFTSHLALGEVLAGAEKSSDSHKVQATQAALKELAFSYLPFDAGAVKTFSQLRARERLRVADSIHLACAASAGVDLFLTGDKQLLRLDVPGIQFIADFNSPIL